jgi:hypothetical protein
MKYVHLIPLAAAAIAASSLAQNSQIFRCAGNVYTNNAAEARAKGCKTMEGGNITVVEGTKVNSPIRVATAPQSSSSQRVDADDQRARDADARAILEAELKKAETRQAELLKEYNNGEPEMLGPEHRNRQKYDDRVAELKASIGRADSDIAGIKRELGRFPASK